MKTPPRRYADTFFLVGPTAVGKSSLAQWIAEHLDYDILSADSMLMYKGMDIGTAKPGAAARARVRYYGIDLMSPDEPFSVWAYSRYARDVLAKGAKTARKVIVVGGTGLYIKSLTDGLSSIPGPDPLLREYWTHELKKQGVGALQEALRRKNTGLYRSLKDKQNPRRLIRALEMAEKGRGECEKTWKERSTHVPLAGMTLPNDQLKSRIESRVTEMYRHGFVEEVEDLLKRYTTLSPTARQGIGYAEVMDLLDGRCTRTEAIARTITRSRQLAKRQRTWFRNQANVEWIEVDMGMEMGRMAKMVMDHWKKYGPTRIDNY